MPFEIHRTRNPAPKVKRALLGWGKDLFSIDRYGLEWRPWTWTFIGSLGPDPVTHVGALCRTIRVNGRPIPVGGIAAVITLPAARGNGYARQTLDAATGFLRDEHNVPFAFLFCRDALLPFYGKTGWQKIIHPVLIDQPQGKTPNPLNAMTLPLGTDPWPPGEVELNSYPW